MFISFVALVGCLLVQTKTLFFLVEALYHQYSFISKIDNTLDKKHWELKFQILHLEAKFFSIQLLQNSDLLLTQANLFGDFFEAEELIKISNLIEKFQNRQNEVLMLNLPLDFYRFYMKNTCLLFDYTIKNQLVYFEIFNRR